MNSLISIIISCMLSRLIFSFLLDILNNNMWSIFNVISKDFSKLTTTTRCILRLSALLMTMLIVFSLNVVFYISPIEIGLILGFLLAVEDNCFKTDMV